MSEERDFTWGQKAFCLGMILFVLCAVQTGGFQRSLLTERSTVLPDGVRAEADGMILVIPEERYVVTMPTGTRTTSLVLVDRRDNARLEIPTWYWPKLQLVRLTKAGRVTREYLRDGWVRRT